MNMSSLLVFSGVRASRTLIFCVAFCRSLFVFFRLANVLSVLLRFTDSDYPFGMAKLLLMLSAFFYTLLIIFAYSAA